MTPPPARQERISVDRQMAMDWFTTHLSREPICFDVYQGVTTPAVRIDNIRRCIAQKGLADKILGRYNGKPETYRQYCKRALGIDLDAPQESLL